MALAEVPSHLMNAILEVTHYGFSLVWLQIVSVTSVRERRLLLRVPDEMILPL